ncbi:MAG: threonine synthase, partial [Alphaproteobacteria bacterium]
MKYISTRGDAPTLDFADVLLAGLARDGGLYVPEEWPHFSAEEIAELAGLPYDALALRIVAPFVGAAIAPADLRRLVADSWAGFDHAAVAP